MALIGVRDLAIQLGTLTEAKNKAYGDSFFSSAEFLKLLYPNGVHPSQFGDMLCIVRIYDKLARIATDQDAFGESPYNDIVGYALLGSIRHEFLKNQSESV